MLVHGHACSEGCNTGPAPVYDASTVMKDVRCDS
jgi:hypothetical protein